MTKHTNDGVKRLSLLILLSSIGFFATFCSAAASEACTSEEPPPKPYNPYEGGGHFTSSEKPVERLSLAPTYFAEIDSKDCSSSSATKYLCIFAFFYSYFTYFVFPVSFARLKKKSTDIFGAKLKSQNKKYFTLL